jgi:hypothetical protein
MPTELDINCAKCGERLKVRQPCEHEKNVGRWLQIDGNLLMVLTTQEASDFMAQNVLKETNLFLKQGRDKNKFIGKIVTVNFICEDYPPKIISKGDHHV